VSHSPLFAVDEVRVTGLEGERAALVDRLAAVSPGERLLSVDLDAIRDDVIGLPFVREVAVTRVPPSTIQIAVVPRVPVVAVAVPGASWLLDADGVVVAGGVGEGLPVVDAERSVLPGPGVEVSDAAVRNAVEVHVGLPGPLRAQIDRYDAPSERGLRLHLAEDDIWVRFGVAERVPAKAQVIGLLLDQAREQAARAGRSDLGVAELDVRAPDNPVLVPRTDG
jgi:cell division protein FtsQ